MWKVIQFLASLALVGIVTYTCFFKNDPSIKDALLVLWLCYIDINFNKRLTSE